MQEWVLKDNGNSMEWHIDILLILHHNLHQKIMMNIRENRSGTEDWWGQKWKENDRADKGYVSKR